MRSRVIHESGAGAATEAATEAAAKAPDASLSATARPDVEPRRLVRPRPTPLPRSIPGALGPGGSASPARHRFPGAASITSPELWVGVHLEEVAEQEPGWRGLERLAVCAQRFTPRVSLVPPDGLVLEVKGSLHLFNGVEGLGRALARECASLGLKSLVALAPTPLAALVAARVGKPGGFMGQPVPAGDSLPTGDSLANRSVVAGRSVRPMGQPFVVTDPTRLVGQLMPLPLAALRWPQETLDRLARMGVRTIGQALRLPRAGFARRFGTDSLASLDRLTGRAADPRDRFRTRERFRRRRELNYELESHEGLLGALAPLLEELGKFLQARQCGVMKLECVLRHRHAEPTTCVLGLAAPVADVRRLTELLAERLRAIALPEPVRACELRSSSLVTRVLASNSVWQPGEHGGGAGAEAPELIERLRARLGPEAVYGLQVLPGHRPENAWVVREPVAVREPGRKKRSAHEESLRVRGQLPSEYGSVPPEHTPVPWPAFRRPLWLLPVPKLLSERDGLPRRRGPLRLVGEPERIETGWWDGGDIARDYYMALDVHSVRLWVFRERAAPHRWFLHGVFG